MRRLIWGFAGRTYHIVGSHMSQLIYCLWFKIDIFSVDFEIRDLNKRGWVIIYLLVYLNI